MDRLGTGNRRIAWTLLITTLGCVPPLRIVHRDASADRDDVLDATGDVTDASSDVTDATGDVTDATGDVTDATGDVTDATGDATGDVLDARDDGERDATTDATRDAGADEPLDAASDVLRDAADDAPVDVGACASGLSLCDGACVDTQRDLRHCGRCGATCAPVNATATCTAGACGFALCAAGYADCDGVAATGCEVEVRSSVDHCGSCGNACRYTNATPRCAGGSCAIAACSTGYGNCDGSTTNGCETDLRTTLPHCGACGHACATGQNCVAGECIEVQQSCAAAGVPGCGLVMVPGGTFTLGSDVVGDAQAGTQVSAFYMDRYEVTQARFRAFWDAGHPTPATIMRYPGGVDMTVTGAINTVAELTSDPACIWRRGSFYDSYPMNCVNWYTATAFCVWDGGRLPTHAEWELASAGTDGRHVPWRSTALPAGEANAAELSTHTCVSPKFPPALTLPCPVDLFEADRSPSGVIGTYGNVNEWVGDRYTAYGHSGSGCWPGPGQLNPICLSSSAPARVVRGGTIWPTSADEIDAVQTPYGDSPSATSIVLGFRCARSR